MSAQTEDREVQGADAQGATDANHPDNEPGQTTEDPKPKAGRKKTKYEELGLQRLTQPGEAKLPYLGETGRFKTGHDAKLKRDLIAMVLRGKDAPKVGGVANAESAETLLGKLGWRSHLDASRKAAEGKAQRTAKAAEAKAQRTEAAQNKKDGKAANDRIEQAKKAKAAANEWVDEVVQVTVDDQATIGQVLRVARKEESDIESEFVATVQVRENPQDADSPTSEVEVPVSELRKAS